MMAEKLLEDQLHWKCDRCQTLNSGRAFECTWCKSKKPYSEPPTSSEPQDDFNADADIRDKAWRSYVYPTCQDLKASGGARRKHRAEEPLEFPDKVCRLILLGRTGSGKSSTGNSIIGFEHYPVSRSFRSATDKCWWHAVQRFGIPLEVVDTPGLFDTNLEDAVVTKEVVKCVGYVAPGPHALLIVIRADVRFTQEEAKTVEHIRSLFGADIMRHVIVVFTHGDDLAGCDLKQWLGQCPEDLAKLLEEVDMRYCIFNNKETNPEKKTKQVRDLLLTVTDLLATTGNQSFTSPFLLRCRETVMTHASHLTEMLAQSCTSETALNLIKAALDAGDNAQDVIHQLMDDREQVTAELEDLREQMKLLESDRASTSSRANDLDRELQHLTLKKDEVTQKLKDLEKALKDEKKNANKQREENQERDQRIKDLEEILKSAQDTKRKLEEELEKEKNKNPLHYFVRIDKMVHFRY